MVELTANSVLVGTTRRARLLSRNAVSYAVVRAWRAEAKSAALYALKECKMLDGGAALATTAAGEIADVLSAIGGGWRDFTITSVPCGHSRRPDCFGRRLAEAVATAMGLPFRQIWWDRFCAGSSHPRQNAKLPPLQWLADAPPSMLVIDDVATSGWHLEEALNAARSRGAAAFGVAWIGGELSDADRAKLQPAKRGELELRRLVL